MEERHVERRPVETTPREPRDAVASHRGETTFRELGLRVFTTCEQSTRSDRDSYADQVARLARWSEESGCEGILVYTDNSLVDPWLVSQLIIENTEILCPLVAIQPVYMHPYSVAKMVSSLAFLHGRRIWLNLVAGGFRLDLEALSDTTPHDERYDRLVEYGQVVVGLLEGTPVTFDGRYYTVKALGLSPRLPEELMPGITVSGSSPAGRRAARMLDATSVKYPQRFEEETQTPTEYDDVGMRCGVIARETDEEAWDVALDRFPVDRKGQLTHGLAMRVSDSHWHRQLADLGKQQAFQDAVYWLGPFENYKTFCPYLVGSYDRVGDELARYLSIGFRTFILDIPASREELDHSVRAFARALRAS